MVIVIDIAKRLKSHNQGKVRSTRARRPFALHYQENYDTKSEAYRREMFFKSFEGRMWLIQNKIIEERLGSFITVVTFFTWAVTNCRFN